MSTGERGSVFLRLLIVILSVAVVLAVVVPQLRQMKEGKDTTLCREQMIQLAQAQDTYLRMRGHYTENLDSLRALLPPGSNFSCPTNGSPYLLTAVDSTNYTISCPNEHGLINSGKKSWEKK
jgi:type II secretory pathway pseudopilin PulG